mmetsp:Transcript_41504/g.89126  ORF Transcript_41504/g.89126 Transcript_41504/m.89126 type:complete len:390 (-) Transcript_41504:1032-2201(-)
MHSEVNFSSVASRGAMDKPVWATPSFASLFQCLLVGLDLPDVPEGDILRSCFATEADGATPWLGPFGEAAEAAAVVAEEPEALAVVEGHVETQVAVGGFGDAMVVSRKRCIEGVGAKKFVEFSRKCSMGVFSLGARSGVVPSLGAGAAKDAQAPPTPTPPTVPWLLLALMLMQLFSRSRMAVARPARSAERLELGLLLSTFELLLLVSLLLLQLHSRIGRNDTEEAVDGAREGGAVGSRKMVVAGEIVMTSALPVSEVGPPGSVGCCLYCKAPGLCGALLPVTAEAPERCRLLAWHCGDCASDIFGDCGAFGLQHPLNKGKGAEGLPPGRAGTAECRSTLFPALGSTRGDPRRVAVASGDNAGEDWAIRLLEKACATAAAISTAAAAVL